MIKPIYPVCSVPTRCLSHDKTAPLKGLVGNTVIDDVSAPFEMRYNLEFTVLKPYPDANKKFRIQGVNIK